MILELDLGNTRFKWRVRDEHKITTSGYQLNASPFSDLELSLKPFRKLIKKVWVASVVAEKLELDLIIWCKSFLSLDPEFARAADFCAGVMNGYEEPSKLGVDRWLGIISGYNRLQKAFVLISCGTAITVDLVLHNGKHLGGFIAPGINLMLDSLQQRTHLVSVEQNPGALTLRPGITTANAVHAALAAMLVGLIENALAQIYEFELGAQVEVLFTGGDSEKFLPFHPKAQQISDLVLDGLGYVLSDSKNLER